MQLEDANFVNQRSYNNKGYQGQLSINLAYHPNNRNHPNFSYANPNNSLTPPPGFSFINGVSDVPKKINVDGLVTRFMENTETDIGEMRHLVIDLIKIQAMLRTQMDQLSHQLGAIHQPGKLPSETITNSKDQCNTIHLGSGTQYQGSEIPTNSGEKLEEKAKIATRTTTAVKEEQVAERTLLPTVTAVKTANETQATER